MDFLPIMSPDQQGRYDLIQSALRRQQLRSERQRVFLFVGLLGFLLLVLLLLRAVPWLIREDLRPQLYAVFLPMGGLLCVFLAYEVCVLAWLSRLLRTDRLPPAAFPYVNALVEVSLPTVAIVVGSGFIGALPMLSGGVPFVYFLFLCLAALNLNARLCLFAGAVASVEFLVASLLLLRHSPAAAGAESPLLAIISSPHQSVTKSLFLLMGGCLVAFVAMQIRRQLMSALETVEERDRAISIFGQHVSPQVAELLLHQPVGSAAQERQVCVMFLDIRDFSRFAGDHSPSEVMEYLNTLFSFMIPVINDHSGIINKFLGDGFMAVFGAPLDDSEPCRNAVDASRIILEKIDEMNRGQKIPPTRLGIGLHLGMAITGNVGGGERKEYTVIGDAVNLAARIEQATKQFQAQLMVSEEVFRALASPAGEDLGMIELKGQAKPVRLFKLV
jgi:adenylate cyclase